MPVVGIVTTRTCPHCGHHEVGIVTEKGKFLTLKPGMWVEILEQHKKTNQCITEPTQPNIQPNIIEYTSQPSTSSHLVPWVPPPLLPSKELCLKYGVLLHPENADKPITPQVYKSAYLKKLYKLIKKEVAVPLAVILDQYFTAPHLASGDTKEIVEALWENLDEIRLPVDLISDWLKDPSQENLAKLASPFDMEEIAGSGVRPSTEQLHQALESLTLEEFFRILVGEA